MIRKVGLGVAAVFVLGTLILGSDVYSYISTSASKLRSAAKDSVPIEFEIDRARDMVTGLVPEIKKNMGTIAQEEVAIERLTKQISALSDRMVTSKADILTLQTDLGKQPAAVRFTYCGKSYTRGQVESDLANRFERYQIDEATLASLDKMKSVREQSLQAAKSKLTEYMAQKRELEVRLEQLTARLKMVELAKTTSDHCFNEDKLGKAKSLIEELQGRLEVEERLVGGKGDLTNEVVLTDRKTEIADIAQKVAQYFASDPKPAPIGPLAPIPPAKDSSSGGIMVKGDTK